MRVDQYLWCIRYYKSRNQASLGCKQGHVRIGDQLVKPSREVIIGDKIKVRKNNFSGAKADASRAKPYPVSLSHTFNKQGSMLASRSQNKVIGNYIE